MDPRIREHADIVVDHCVDLQQGDHVVVNAPPMAEDLVVALYEAIGERGAHPISTMRSSRSKRALLRATDPDDFELPEHTEAMMEAADVIVSVGGSANRNEMGDVDPDAISARQQVMEPLGEIQMEKRWVATQHPAPGQAQKAEMSTEAYADFVYDAVNKDWAAQREFQAQLVEILEPAEEVRVVSGDTTDVTMSIAGNPALNDYAEKNLPGGEVFTTPIPDSVEGEVLFDKPLVAQGREVQDVYLRFEDGAVVEHDAAKNEDLLASVLDTDDGARRLGELGIGMNRDIDRFTYNMLFDEKMGDTVHLALGRAYDDAIGEEGAGNESAVHMDMIVDMSEDSYIEVDGEVVQRDGTFRFEESEA